MELTKKFPPSKAFLLSVLPHLPLFYPLKSWLHIYIDLKSFIENYEIYWYIFSYNFTILFKFMSILKNKLNNWTHRKGLSWWQCPRGVYFVPKPYNCPKVRQMHDENFYNCPQFACCVQWNILKFAHFVPFVGSF